MIDALTLTNCLIMANDKKEKESEKYSENDQWNDDLDVMPLNYVKPEGKKPIVEKAEFDKKKKKRWIPIVAMISIIAGSTPFIFRTCEDRSVTPKKTAVISLK